MLKAPNRVETAAAFLIYIMSYILRYDMNYGMIDSSFKPMHPQEQLKADGMKEINSESLSIGDCWIFEVEELANPLPAWYQQIDNFKFSKS